MNEADRKSHSYLLGLAEAELSSLRAKCGRYETALKDIAAHPHYANGAQSSLLKRYTLILNTAEEALR